METFAFVAPVTPDWSVTRNVTITVNVWVVCVFVTRVGEAINARLLGALVSELTVVDMVCVWL